MFISTVNRYEKNENVAKVVITLNNTESVEKSIIILIYNIEDDLNNQLLKNFRWFHELKNKLDFDISDLNIVVQLETKSSKNYTFTI